MACAKVHQGGCDGEGLAAGAVVMVVGGGGGFASARAKREWEKAMVERGEARQGSGQSYRVGSLAEIDRAPCSLHVFVPSARRRRGGGKIGKFENS